MRLGRLILAATLQDFAFRFQAHQTTLISGQALQEVGRQCRHCTRHLVPARCLASPQRRVPNVLAALCQINLMTP